MNSEMKKFPIKLYNPNEFRLIENYLTRKNIAFSFIFLIIFFYLNERK